jgi:hypothetical protein
MSIKVDEKGQYYNGHFGGTIDVAVEGTGKYRQVGTTRLFQETFPVSEWTGETKNAEYWECNACYDRLEEKRKSPPV